MNINLLYVREVKPHLIIGVVCQLALVSQMHIRTLLPQYLLTATMEDDEMAETGGCFSNNDPVYVSSAFVKLIIPVVCR